MKYFKELTDNNQPALIRYEEGETCEKYNYKKKAWEPNFKTFAKMCMGDIDAEVVTVDEVNKYIK